MAYIKIDEEKRIISASYDYHCGDGEIVVDIPETITLPEIHSYKYINGEFVYSPKPTDNIERISELKSMLAETDYIVIKIVEGAATWEDYPEIKEQRRLWRNEINELENN